MACSVCLGMSSHLSNCPENPNQGPEVWPCDACEGTGGPPDAPCQACKGTGEVMENGEPVPDADDDFDDVDPDDRRSRR